MADLAVVVEEAAAAAAAAAGNPLMTLRWDR